jgi:hypothetical protein
MNVEPAQSVAPLAHENWRGSTPHALPPYGIDLDAKAIFNRTFKSWSEDARRLIATNAAPYIALFVAMAVVGAGLFLVAGSSMFEGAFWLTPSPALLVSGGVGLGLLGACLLLFLAAQAGTFLLLEERARKEPQQLGVMAALGAGLPLLWRMLGVMLATGALLGAVCLPLLAAGTAAAFTESVALTLAAVVIGIATIPLCIAVSVRVLVAAPVAVLEDRTAIDSIRRSVELTRGNVGPTLGALVLVVLAMVGVAFASSIVGIVPVLGQLVSLAVSVATAPLWTCFAFVAYAALKDQERPSA